MCIECCWKSTKILKDLMTGIMDLPRFTRGQIRLYSICYKFVNKKRNIMWKKLLREVFSVKEGVKNEKLLKWVSYVWSGVSLEAQLVKNAPAMQETLVPFLGREDPPEEGMATHSSVLAWRIPWTEEPGGLQSMRLQRVGHDWATEHNDRENWWHVIRHCDLSHLTVGETSHHHGDRITSFKGYSDQYLPGLPSQTW